MQKRMIAYISLLIFLLLLSIFAVTQRRYLKRHNIDIDLNSGVCRDRYYFWFVPISTKTFETEYSKLVQPYIVKKNPIWYNDVEVGSLFSYYSSGGEWGGICHDFAIFIQISKFNESQNKEYIEKSLQFLKNKDLKGFQELVTQIESNTRLEIVAN